MQTVIFYDTECVFCSFWIQWIFKRDGGFFRVALPQSSFYQEQKRIYDEVHQFGNSVLVIDQGRCYQKSEAVLFILSKCGWAYRLLSTMLKVFPLTLRNWVYDLVAKNRHKIARKTQQCQLVETSRIAS